MNKQTKKTICKSLTKQCGCSNEIFNSLLLHNEKAKSYTVAVKTSISVYRKRPLMYRALINNEWDLLLTPAAKKLILYIDKCFKLRVDVVKFIWKKV